MDRECAATGLLDGRDRFVRAVIARVVRQRDKCAFLREPLGYRAPDTARASGGESGLSSQ